MTSVCGKRGLLAWWSLAVGREAVSDIVDKAAAQDTCPDARDNGAAALLRR